MRIKRLAKMSSKFTLAQLASLSNAELVGDSDHAITGINSLEDATQAEASFLSDNFLLQDRYKTLLQKTRAGVICISSKVKPPQGKNVLISNDPSITFQIIAKLFVPESTKTGFSGIHPSAVIHEKATIGQNTQIGPFVVIDKDVTIGDNTIIHPHVTIGAGARLGNDCTLYSQVTIREGCILKDRVIIQPGAVIGSCGFGYITDNKGNHNKLEQLGIVILEDDVEIGANTAIDRARFKHTTIGRGTKIDNLVQIAHNVEIGPNNLFAAQTGIAGSAKTGSHVYGGGQVGILGHVKVTDKVMLATRSGVSKTLTESGTYRGSPAIEIKSYGRQKAHVRKLEQYLKRIKALEVKLQSLEETK